MTSADWGPETGDRGQPAARRRPRWGPIAAVAVIVFAFGWLLYGGIDKNVVYFLTPQELLDRGATGMDVPVRLGGQVQPGSVKWDDRTLDLRFVVVDTGGRGPIPVKSTGAPPQMFRDGQGVVIEGRLGRDGVFHSTNLMVKHSNEYRAPKAGERPHDLYKTLMKGAGAGGSGGGGGANGGSTP